MGGQKIILGGHLPPLAPPLTKTKQEEFSFEFDFVLP